jgi:hypothetical protein
MKRIPINTKSQKTHQRMAWTEKCTGKGHVKNEIKVYHYSDTPIKVFAPVETCFFHYFFSKRKGLLKGPNVINKNEYLYELTIPAGTYVELYEEEVRIELSPDMIIYDVTNENTERPQGIKI